MNHTYFKKFKMFFKINSNQKSSLHLILILNLFFGSYYNHSTSKIASVLLRIYCVFFTLITLFLMIQFSPVGIIGVPFTITAIEFVFFMCVSQIHSQKYVLEFINFINTCDKLIGSGYIPVDIHFNAVFLFVILIRLGLMYLLLQFSSGLITLCWFLLLMSLDIRFLKITALIRLLHIRLKILRNNLEQNRIPVNIVKSYKMNRNISVVRKCLLNYNHLLDGFDDINVTVQIEFFFTLIFNIAKLIINTYYAVKMLTFDIYYIIVISVTVNSCQLFFLLSVPCVASEMCMTEVDGIRALLTKQILRCSDDALRRELQWALDSVSRRPFDFTLLRAIPVNIHLLATMFTLCVTYVILLIQFTHFISL